MEKEVKVYMFVDALGYDIADRHKFMAEELPYRKKVEMQFGYSAAAVPTILSGRPPREHGHFSFFYYDEKNSPFKIFKLVKYFFGAGLHPRCFFNRGRVRHIISKFFAKWRGYTGYFNLYGVPFERLPYFDYCEKNDIFTAGGLAPCKNLCDVLLASGKKFHISNWRNSDAQNIDAAVAAIEDGAEFLFVYSGSFDSFMHMNAGDENAVSAKLEDYKKMARTILSSLEKRGDKYSFTMISDHGMSPLSGVLDVASELKKLPLKFGEDCVWLLDSTMARFWYLKPEAKEIVRRAMKGFDKLSLISAEQKVKYGIDFKGDKFGNDIFISADGVQISPNDLGAKPLRGMHGFMPEAKESYASFMSTSQAAFEPEHVADFFELMRLDIEGK